MNGDVHKVAVILVNWNGREDTLACLASLSSGTSVHVIVVDNGSVDGSAAAIRTAHPEVEVIETGRNLGFTGGNNVGIQRALADDADYVFLLNNDTVVEPNALAELLRVAEQRSEFGILTPMIYYFDRPSEPWLAGSRLDLSRGIAVHDNAAPPPLTQDVVELPWASGCAMLIRRSVMEQLRGFDDRFFLNWEDVDLSLRATKLNIKIGLVPAAKIYHKVGRSFATTWGTGAYYYVRNHLLLTSLHANSRRAVARVLMGHVRQALRGIVKGEPKGWRSARVIGEGIFDFLRGRFGPRRATTA